MDMQLDEKINEMNDKKEAFSLGHYKNINIEVHFSWFFVMVLLTYSLATAFFPMYFQSFTKTEYWIISLIAAALLFLSIFLHELSHSLVALKNKIPIEKITLFFFGGVSSMDDSHITPAKEFKIAIAGPLFSFFFAAFFYGIELYFTNKYVDAIAFYLTRLNLMIALFNLVPGYPLDGGRVFRAIMWKITKDMRKATRYAASAGKLFAWALIFLGVFIIISMNNFSGLWYVVLGLFLVYLANASYQQVILRDILSKVAVEEIITKEIAPINHELSLRELAQKFTYSAERCFLVNKNDRLIGFVQSEFLKKIPEYKWDVARADDIAVNIDFIKVQLGTPLHKILGYMLFRNLEYILIVQKTKVLGIIEREKLMNIIKIYS
ncbi:site-2 protease family protein [Candidatus Woesearchaeota archaeon]|nr:site-2 protease family protein [Candidatus Woesearchaeota archaeon]